MTRLLCCCLGLALVLPSGARAADAREPSYAEKPLSYWLKALNDKDRPEQQRAVDAMIQFGPAAHDAIPALIALLRETKDQPKELNFRISLVAALGRMGPEAREAMPDILPLLRGEYPYDAVCIAVVQIGAPEADERLAVQTLLLRLRRCSKSILLSNPQFVQENATRIAPHLAVLLKDDAVETRRKAAQGLALIGPKAQAVAANLEAALKDTDEEVCRSAAVALAKTDAKQVEPMVAFLVRHAVESPTRSDVSFALASIGPDVLPHLVPLLEHEKAAIAQSACQAFVFLGQPSVPFLAKILAADGSVKSRAAAAQALGQLYYSQKSARSALLAALKDGESDVRLTAAEALSRFGPADVELALPVLTAIVEQGVPAERMRALTTLFTLGPKAKETVPVLIRVLEDKAPSVRQQAALALEAIDRTKAAAAVPVLSEIVVQGTIPCRVEVPAEATARAIVAAAALGRIGAPARSALPALQRSLRVKAANLIAASAEALVLIDPQQAEPAVTALTNLLKNDPKARHLVLQALNVLGPTAKTAAPVLEGMLEGKPGLFDYELAGTLVHMDPSRTKKVLERLGRAEQDEDQTVELLCQIAPAAPEDVVPRLVNLLNDSKNTNGYQQREAVNALGAVGAKAGAAVPVLLQLAANKKNSLGRAAAEAVKKIDPEAAAQAGIR